jgi:hypothetical protein
MFDEYVQYIDYIKYTDGRIDKCSSLKQFWEYKNQLMDKYQKMFQGLTVRMMPSILNQTGEEEMTIQNYKLNMEYINKIIKDETDPLFEHINYISELSYTTNVIGTTRTTIMKLEQGCLHSLEEAAYILVDVYRQYFIYGEMISYEDWLKHPLVRKRKIEKIRNGQRNTEILH